MRYHLPRLQAGYLIGHTTALIFILVAVSTACRASPPETLSRLVEGIVSRSAELTYVTDQDSEVFAFYRNASIAKMSDSVFLDLIRRPPETEINRLSWSAFFQVRTSRDATGRWRNLQLYLEANLTELTVFQIPRDAPYDSQYDLFAVGLFNDNTVVGVQMFGVAT